VRLMKWPGSPANGLSAISALRCKCWGQRGDRRILRLATAQEVREESSWLTRAEDRDESVLSVTALDASSDDPMDASRSRCHSRSVVRGKLGRVLINQSPWRPQLSSYAPMSTPALSKFDSYTSTPHVV
jgi:hypothetical protein